MTWLLRALLWLAPREFRGRFGGELLDFYEQRTREARPLAWPRVFLDLLATILIEWGRVLGTIASPHDHQRTLTSGERMSVIGQEIAHAVRSLRKNTAFTAAAVVTLALGLASTTAIFSIVDSVLLRPLPFSDSDRVVVPQSHDLGRNDKGSWVSYADFMDWRDNRVFAAVGAFTETGMDLTGAGDPVRVNTVVVTPQFFAALGTPAARGRVLEPYDYPVDAPRAVVISDRFWRTQFGAREDIIGTTIEMNGIKRPIVGVLAPEVRWPLTGDVWVPLRLSAETGPDLLRRDNFMYQSIARLKPGATMESTRAAMAMLAARVARDFPNIRKNITTEPTPVLEWLLGATTPRALWILLGAVGLLLLIACVNVANLQLARATSRQRELAVRTALGASRYRLIRQTLIESAILGLTGGVMGLVAAMWLVKAIVRAAPPGVPRIESASLSISGMAFAFGASVVVALLFGLVPALQASRSDPNLAMGESTARTAGGRSAARTRRALVMAELALSVVLLVGAGLALRTIQQLRATRAGFDAPSVLTASISLPGMRYRSSADVIRFWYDLRDRLAATPGILGAGITSASPLGGGGFYLGRSMAAEGKAPLPENERPVNWQVASPGYFAALGVPIRGRDFTARDDTAAAQVMIVNESFAKSLYGSLDVIGKRAMSTRDEKVYREIVGVVPDFKFMGVRDTARALVWVPYAQNYAWGIGNITLRTQGSPLNAVAVLRREVAALDRNLALADIGTMDQAAARSIAGDRMIAVLLTAFAILALALAAVGIFGVLSYAVAQRTRELGVRMALGAQRRDVLTLVLRETAPLVGGGIGIGIAAGLGVTQLMRALLFGIEPTDLVTFVGVPLLLAFVGLIAALIPARRASQVDPLIALRGD
jgi:putative ABC transport system permease protein